MTEQVTGADHKIDPANLVRRARWSDGAGSTPRCRRRPPLPPLDSRCALALRCPQAHRIIQIRSGMAAAMVQFPK